MRVQGFRGLGFRGLGGLALLRSLYPPHLSEQSLDGYTLLVRSWVLLHFSKLYGLMLSYKAFSTSALKN